MPDFIGTLPTSNLVHSSGRPLRVAHLTTVDMSLALLLATELEVDVRAGIQTYGLSAPGPYLPQISSTGASHCSIPSLTRSWDLGRDVAAMRELLAVLRQLRPDVLHTHNPKTGVMGRIIGRIARVPVVVNTCHGLWASPADSLRKRIAVYSVEVMAAAFSDAELYQNEPDRRALAQWIRQSKAQVVGNGTDLQRFTPDAEVRVATRAELGVREDDLLVGGVGRLVAEKGVEEFAHAARALEGKAKFVWAGPSDSGKPDAVSVIDHEVEFLGEIADMPAFYNAVDVFVLPSYREGFSRSAMEAAACGTAMVLSDIRGCREIGVHGRDVLLSPPGDEVALTICIERLLRDDQLRDELARAARLRALKCFDQRKVADASIKTYQRVADRKNLGWKTVSTS